MDDEKADDAPVPSEERRPSAEIEVPALAGANVADSTDDLSAAIPPLDDEAPLETAPRSPLRAAWQRWLAARTDVQRFLARLDPNDDPGAEPLGLLPLLALTVALGAALFMYWKWKFQPMQDLGHHVGLSAVVADWGRKGSIYTELYDTWSAFHANTLLYTFAGNLGKLIGVTRACRVGMSFYIAGVPLANLYALRVFGRSAWPAVISVPLVYFNMNFVGGFANLLFAAPFMVLSVPTLYRAITAPTWRRVLLAACCYVGAFLSHAHAFLWAGFLGFCVTFVVVVGRFAGAGLFGEAPTSTARVTTFRFWRPRLSAAGISSGIAGLVVVPSLLLFWRWYAFAFGEGRKHGAVTVVTTGIDQGFGAAFKETDGLFRDLFDYAFKITIKDGDLLLFWKLGLITAIAVVVARFHKWRRPPILELVFVLSFFSYFEMPESIDSNPVVGSRQIGIACWFFPAILAPVPAEVSRLLRWGVITATLWITYAMLSLWSAELTDFEKTEASGLEWVLDAAPPRQHLHLVKVIPDTSKVFTWKPLWHVEKFYMADKFGQVADNPAIVSTSPIRYKEGVDPHRIPYHSADWPKWKELRDNYELVLVHGWTPTPEQLAAAKENYVRVRQAGDYELWRKKGPWQTGAGPADGK